MIAIVIKIKFLKKRGEIFMKKIINKQLIKSEDFKVLKFLKKREGFFTLNILIAIIFLLSAMFMTLYPAYHQNAINKERDLVAVNVRNMELENASLQIEQSKFLDESEKFILINKIQKAANQSEEDYELQQKLLEGLQEYY